MYSLTAFVSVLFITIVILIIIALVSGQRDPSLGPYYQHGGRGYVAGPYYEHGGRITHDGRLY
jgi:hypothetical protein